MDREGSISAPVDAIFYSARTVDGAKPCREIFFAERSGRE